MKKINLLMISSTAKLGGGPIHMFNLGEKISTRFNVFYALPRSNDFLKKYQKGKYLEIKERKISIIDLLNLIIFTKKNSIQIIHSHGKGASYLGRLIALILCKPHVYTFHGIHLDCHNFFIKKIYLIYENLTGFVDKYKILVSNSEREYACKVGLYLDKKDIVINNGVINNENKKNIIKNIYSLKKGLYLDTKKIHVINIARLVKQKNIFEFLEIGRILPHINFLILGDGPLFQEISDFIKANNIKNIFLKGAVRNVLDYLYCSDIYLSTSLYEGLPISLLEAMSVGLPIVASSVIGNIDTIEEGKSGFFYKKGNINEAAHLIQFLCENHQERSLIGQGSFQRQRKNFSEKKMINKFLNLYETMI